jgi:hypothetical protein
VPGVCREIPAHSFPLPALPRLLHLPQQQSQQQQSQQQQKQAEEEEEEAKRYVLATILRIHALFVLPFPGGGAVLLPHRPDYYRSSPLAPQPSQPVLLLLPYYFTPANPTTSTTSRYICAMHVCVCVCVHVCI